MEELFIFNNTFGGSINLYNMMCQLKSDYFNQSVEMKNVIIMDMKTTQSGGNGGHQWYNVLYSNGDVMFLYENTSRLYKLNRNDAKQYLKEIQQYLYYENDYQSRLLDEEFGFKDENPKIHQLKNFENSIHSYKLQIENRDFQKKLDIFKEDYIHKFKCDDDPELLDFYKFLNFTQQLQNDKYYIKYQVFQNCYIYNIIILFLILFEICGIQQKEYIEKFKILFQQIHDNLQTDMMREINLGNKFQMYNLNYIRDTYIYQKFFNNQTNKVKTGRIIKQQTRNLQSKLFLQQQTINSKRTIYNENIKNYIKYLYNLQSECIYQLDAKKFQNDFQFYIMMLTEIDFQMNKMMLTEEPLEKYKHKYEELKINFLVTKHYDVYVENTSIEPYCDDDTLQMMSVISSTKFESTQKQKLYNNFMNIHLNNCTIIKYNIENEIYHRDSIILESDVYKILYQYQLANRDFKIQMCNSIFLLTCLLYGTDPDHQQCKKLQQFINNNNNQVNIDTFILLYVYLYCQNIKYIKSYGQISNDEFNTWLQKYRQIYIAKFKEEQKNINQYTLVCDILYSTQQQKYQQSNTVSDMLLRVPTIYYDFKIGQQNSQKIQDPRQNVLKIIFCYLKDQQYAISQQVFEGDFNITMQKYLVDNIINVNQQLSSIFVSNDQIYYSINNVSQINLINQTNQVYENQLVQPIYYFNNDINKMFQPVQLQDNHLFVYMFIQQNQISNALHYNRNNCVRYSFNNFNIQHYKYLENKNEIIQTIQLIMLNFVDDSNKKNVVDQDIDIFFFNYLWHTKLVYYKYLRNCDLVFDFNIFKQVIDIIYTIIHTNEKLQNQLQIVNYQFYFKLYVYFYQYVMYLGKYLDCTKVQKQMELLRFNMHTFYMQFFDTPFGEDQKYKNDQNMFHQIYNEHLLPTYGDNMNIVNIFDVKLITQREQYSDILYYNQYYQQLSVDNLNIQKMNTKKPNIYTLPAIIMYFDQQQKIQIYTDQQINFQEQQNSNNQQLNLTIFNNFPIEQSYKTNLSNVIIDGDDKYKYVRLLFSDSGEYLLSQYQNHIKLQVIKYDVQNYAQQIEDIILPFASYENIIVIQFCQLDLYQLFLLLVYCQQQNNFRLYYFVLLINMEYQIVQCYMKYKNLCEFYVKFTNFTFPFVYLSIENAKYMIESNISQDVLHEIQKAAYSLQQFNNQQYNIDFNYVVRKEQQTLLDIINQQSIVKDSNEQNTIIISETGTGKSTLLIQYDCSKNSEFFEGIILITLKNAQQQLYDVTKKAQQFNVNIQTIQIQDYKDVKILQYIINSKLCTKKITKTQIKQTVIVIMDYVMYQYVSINKKYQQFIKDFYVICDEIQQNYQEPQLNVKIDKNTIHYQKQKYQFMDKYYQVNMRFNLKTQQNQMQILQQKITKMKGQKKATNNEIIMQIDNILAKENDKKNIEENDKTNIEENDKKNIEENNIKNIQKIDDKYDYVDQIYQCVQQLLGYKFMENVKRQIQKILDSLCIDINAGIYNYNDFIIQCQQNNSKYQLLIKPMYYGQLLCNTKFISIINTYVMSYYLLKNYNFVLNIYQLLIDNGALISQQLNKHNNNKIVQNMLSIDFSSQIIRNQIKNNIQIQLDKQSTKQILLDILRKEVDQMKSTLQTYTSCYILINDIAFKKHRFYTATPIFPQKKFIETFKDVQKKLGVQQLNNDEKHKDVQKKLDIQQLNNDEKHKDVQKKLDIQYLNELDNDESYKLIREKHLTNVVDVINIDNKYFDQLQKQYINFEFIENDKTIKDILQMNYDEDQCNLISFHDLNGMFNEDLIKKLEDYVSENGKLFYRVDQKMKKNNDINFLVEQTSLHQKSMVLFFDLKHVQAFDIINQVGIYDQNLEKQIYSSTITHSIIFVQNNKINDTDLVNLIQGEGRNRNKELTQKTIYYIQDFQNQLNEIQKIDTQIYEIKLKTNFKQKTMTQQRQIQMLSQYKYIRMNKINNSYLDQLFDIQQNTSYQNEKQIYPFYLQEYVLQWLFNKNKLKMQQSKYFIQQICTIEKNMYIEDDFYNFLQKQNVDTQDIMHIDQIQGNGKYKSINDVFKSQINDKLHKYIDQNLEDSDYFQNDQKIVLNLNIEKGASKNMINNQQQSKNKFGFFNNVKSNTFLVYQRDDKQQSFTDISNFVTNIKNKYNTWQDYVTIEDRIKTINDFYEKNQNYVIGLIDDVNDVNQLFNNKQLQID